MKTIATAIPDNLAPQMMGEEIQFQALVQADGTLLVTRVLHREPPIAKAGGKLTLSEWSRKWAGTMRLKPEETFEDIKRAAYQRKFGL